MNTKPNTNQTLSLAGRTLSISDGNSVELPNGATPYDDADLKRRVGALESKTDNFVNAVTSSRDGNKVKLTYNYVNGTHKEVEFEDKDTVNLAYDDSALKARVKALEDRPQSTSTTYNDKPLRDQITALESKSDNNQVFRVSKKDIPWKEVGGTAVIDKNTLVNPDGVKPNDIIEDYYNGDTGASIEFWKVTSVNGNSINLQKLNHWIMRNDKQTISRQGNKLVLSNGGGEVDLPNTGTALPYDDTGIKTRLSLLESKPDKYITGLVASRNGNQIG